MAKSPSDKARLAPHMLRYHLSTYCLRNGAEVKLIPKILGHSLVGITLDVYRTVTEGEVKAEHTRFGRLADSRLY